jgi:ATP-dependent RNA helicase DeaD
MAAKPGKPGGGKPFGKPAGKKPVGKAGAPKGRPGFGGSTPPKRNKP